MNLPDRPLPKHPFRDSAVAYGILAGAVVGIGLITGGGLLKTVVIAVVFFLVATAYSWWRFRQRLAARGGRRP